MGNIITEKRVGFLWPQQRTVGYEGAEKPAQPAAQGHHGKTKGNGENGGRIVWTKTLATEEGGRGQEEASVWSRTREEEEKQQLRTGQNVQQQQAAEEENRKVAVEQHLLHQRRRKERWRPRFCGPS